MSGINLKSKTFLEGLRLYEEDRKIEPEFIMETLKEAVVKAYQKHIDAPSAKVRVDLDNKEMKIFHLLDVVDDESETFDETLDILFSDAKNINPDVKIGDVIEKEIDFSEIGRTSINIAKQMLKQRTKEYEKQKVYDEFKDRQYDLISGIIKTVEDKMVLIDIKTTIGILLKSEQIPGETYREGQTIKTIIKKVSKDSKGSQVVLSRSDALFVKRLFEKEVPEIQSGVIEIKAIAREAGERTKMAVYSKDDDVDPIGACIGPRGSRVQTVIMEIKGEKIDVFEWNDDIGELVKNALAPAEVKACFYANEKTDPNLTPEVIQDYIKYNKRPLVVVVDDDKLSVAIGKKGKNAKLAVKLTNNRKIDIKTQTEIEQLGIDVAKEVEEFKNDQLRIIKEKEMKEFQAIQEEALKRRAEFDAEIANSEPSDEFDELEEKPEEVTILDLKKDKEVEQNKVIENKVVDKKEEEIILDKKPLTPKTEYHSKFEDFADSTKKQDTVEIKKHKKKDDPERRVRSEDLEKKEYGDDVKPIYSDEELEEIEAQEQAEQDNTWINDDIDFDEYDEYYDEEK